MSGGTPSSPAGAPRLAELDGLRGFAALSVVFYHFFVRWGEPNFTPTLYAHGDALSNVFPLTGLGVVGVNLFFVISGFVIMMTLLRSQGLADFAVKRMSRLWPAMLFCATASTLLINLSGVAHVYPNVTRWAVTPVEYFSSLVFFPPDLMAELLGIVQDDRPRWVEGVYWTLWAEVRFYALIAIAFWLSPRAFPWVWAGLQLASTSLSLAGLVMPDAIPLKGPLDMLLQPSLLAWFTLGLVAFLWQRQGFSWPIGVALTAALVDRLCPHIISLAPIGISPSAVHSLVLYTLVAVPFALFLTKSPLMAIFRWRPIVAAGLASYPLYLFHERTGMIYLYWLNSAGIPSWISLAMTFAITLALAWWIHKLVEMPSQRFIRAHLETRAKWLDMRLGLRSRA